jgi:hypothetical protein
VRQRGPAGPRRRSSYRPRQVDGSSHFGFLLPLPALVCCPLLLYATCIRVARIIPIPLVSLIILELSPSILCWCSKSLDGSTSPVERAQSGGACPGVRRLHEALAGRVDFVVDGGPEAGQVSTVVDMTDPERPQVLRVGAGDTEPVLAMI